MPPQTLSTGSHLNPPEYIQQIMTGRVKGKTWLLYLQELKLGGSIQKTLWEPRQPVGGEIPGE